jgi:glycosyltransferase involved in cell wall biosynthesis
MSKNLIDDLKFNDLEKIVSIVIPCLNEEKTIGLVLDEVTKVMNSGRWEYEIILADNGSVDSSIQIANLYGAKVINVETKGYGNALSAGIDFASGSIVAMLDADFTYDSHALPVMIAALVNSSSAMVMGTRLKGSIENGAMPFLHRFVGTPILTKIINNILGSKITDCNSGMRVFLKNRYYDWNMKSSGMEFASEMIINSLLNGDEILEVPINFRVDKRERLPHLRTWNDGMRHLLFIISKAPWLYVNYGVILLLVTSIIAIVSVFGPIAIFGFSVFGYHSLIFAILIGFLGAQSITQGLILETNQPKNKLSKYLLNIKESHLFFAMLTVGVLVASLLILLLISWSINGFKNLAFLDLSLFVVYMVMMIGSISFGLFSAHVAKRLK